jgi:uncharacterized protein YjbI with pentapeptide repeats
MAAIYIGHTSLDNRANMNASSRCVAAWLTLALVLAGARAQADERADFVAGVKRDCPRCDLAGTNFKRRDLTGADLSGANLKGANFHDAKLIGVRLAAPI